MGTRFVEAGVALAALVSALVLGAMLAAPLLPRPATVTPPPASGTASVAPTAPAEEAAPPIGLYLLRGPFSFGPCLALELSPESYPVEDGAEGTATVLTWQRGMTGCDARSDEIQSHAASVSRLMSEDADARLVGYAVRFRAPLDEGASTAVEISILADQSTPELLQALETSTPGASGLVFDRVPAVEPTFNPLPSPTAGPDAGVGPIGLFLLRGPISADVCMAIDLADGSYADGEGTALVRWWEHAGSDPDDLAVCLSRRGDMHEVPAVVIPVPPGGGPPGWTVRFSMPLAEGDEVELTILAERSTQDELRALAVMPPGDDPLVFDRVDELNPPLAPSPSSSPGP